MGRLDASKRATDPPAAPSTVLLLTTDANGTVGGGCADATQMLVDRTVSNEAISPFAYYYNVTGTSSYLTVGDNLFSASFGFDAGTGADSYKGQAFNTLKQHGQSGRSTGTHLANRTRSSVAPVSQTLSIGFNLASVPSATQVTVTLAKPSGELVTATCSSSPCSITADSLQGAHSYLLQYKSSGGAVLASGSYQLAQVQ